jgi:predicted nuclease of restriction endonuclease-like (RecB) superfamily
MKNDEVLRMFKEFKLSWDEEAKAQTWDELSRRLRVFWKEKVCNPQVKELNDAEIDEIIRILDRNAKGNAGQVDAVAKAMIAQGMWRRMFKEFKANAKLREALDALFNETDKKRQMECIDKIYKINEGHKNSLTGKSGNAINAFLGVYSPRMFCHVISLKARRRLIEFFGFDSKINFETDAMGEKIIESNQVILEGFKSFGLMYTHPKTLTRFLYSEPMKSYWNAEVEPESEDAPGVTPQAVVAVEAVKEVSDISLFYMESQLEDFLIENWEMTELGKRFDLIEENGETVSQQYQTEIGRIDILAIDKVTKQYVVIELKKNQTSDDTAGQLARYMGWLEEHMTKGQPTKGLIISARPDARLYYALKKIQGVEFYLYRVNFKLEEYSRK